MPSENSKRIARNTVMLYIRMLFSMGVGLYTSRIVLNVLGVGDFGTYNIIGGVVVLFAFLKNALSSATQRFLNFEMGKGNPEELKKVFNTSMTVHVSIAVIIILLSESIGLWFVNTQLNFPAGRMDAVNWVYQLTIIGFIVGIIIVPYNASIIANERMSFYAYVSIVEVSVKLAVALLIVYIGYDRLITYTLLNTVASFLFFFVYKIYCNSKFDFCSYERIWDKVLYKKLIGFSSWSLMTGIANIGKSQGINILLNIFCGVTMNAAVGIANQLSGALNNFVFNFQQAFSPQIMKSYAAGDKAYFSKLIFQTSKVSYYMLLILSLPVLMNTETILVLWLKNVPEYTLIFSKLTILYILIDAISGPLWVSVQAIGDIKKYQIVISSVLLLNLPLSYLFLKVGLPPYSILWVGIVLCVAALIVRLVFLKKLIAFPLVLFSKEVLLRIVLVTVVSLPLPILVHIFTTGYEGMVLNIIVCFISVGSAVFVLGLKSEERTMVKGKAMELINKGKR
jgi:O-antigen/teichoic acid export membrane protein